jgi:hypothetical protein
LLSQFKDRAAFLAFAAGVHNWWREFFIGVYPFTPPDLSIGISTTLKTFVPKPLSSKL